jgi:hypothetical protein
LSDKERIQQAYLAVFQRLPTSAEIKHAAKFIKSEAKLLAEASPSELVERTSTPEQNTVAPASSPRPKLELSNNDAPSVVLSAPKETEQTTNSTAAPAVASSGTDTNTGASTLATGDVGGNFGGGGGFRGTRTFKGPGSASDIVVGKLAPGIARPKVFHQALPEKPATPEEGAVALFTQALFGSAEFRYLQ